MNMDTKNEISGTTRLFGFFAHPAHHSFSPLMYNLSFKDKGIDARYLAFDVAPGQIKQGIDAMRTLDFGGGNLSMPFKQEVIPYLDEVTKRAQLLESVNVIKNDHGKLIGDSVDGEGFFENLLANNIDTKDITMTIFGAGGAGLSIIKAATEHQVKQLFVFKRRNKTFERVKSQLKKIKNGTVTKIDLIDYDDEDQMIRSVSNSKIIVNTTNLGMGDYQAFMPAPPGVLEHLNSHQIVCDAIYSPQETKLLAFAKQQGCRTLNGLGMLIYQGVLSFEFWTGQQPPIEKIKTAIKQQLAK